MDSIIQELCRVALSEKKRKHVERIHKWVCEMEEVAISIRTWASARTEACPGRGCWGWWWRVRRAFPRLTKSQVGLAWDSFCWGSGSTGNVTSYVTSACKPHQHTLTVVQASKQNVLEELFWTSVKSNPVGGEGVLGPGTQRKWSLIAWACGLGIGLGAMSWWSTGRYGPLWVEGIPACSHPPTTLLCGSMQSSSMRSAVQFT